MRIADGDKVASVALVGETELEDGIVAGAGETPAEA
jgi:hypothetical protein